MVTAPRKNLARSTQVAQSTITQAYGTGVADYTLTHIREAMDTVALQATGEIAKDLEVFAKAMASKMGRNRDFRVTRIHQTAAEEGQAAAVRAFQRRKASARRGAIRNARADKGGGRGVSAPLSRRGPPDRYANGAMLKALRDPAFFIATWDGIGFINKAHLDSRAKQWYRLNYGAGARGEETPAHRQYKVTFFNQVVGTLGLSGGPSPAFKLPAGSFFAPGSSTPVGADPGRTGLDEFFPASQLPKGQKPKWTGGTTKGIKGTNYLDAGVGALAHSLGIGWTILMQEWFKEAATGTRQIRTPTGGVGSVPGTSPVSQFIDQKEAKAALVRVKAAREVQEAAYATYLSSQGLA